MGKYLKVLVPDDFDAEQHKLVIHTNDSLTDKQDVCDIWQPEYRNVLDAGFIGLVDFMGDDQTVVDSARMSYGRGTKRVNEDRNLIRYLIRNRHWTPVEMVEIMWHVKAPIFVFRQWHRHRMASINEYSARYSVMSEDIYMPDAKDLKPQSTTNKQGRDGVLNDNNIYAVQLQLQHAYHEATQAYKYLLGETDTPTNSLLRRKELIEEFCMREIMRMQNDPNHPDWIKETTTEAMIDAKMAEFVQAGGLAFTDEEFLDVGLARELARVVMPTGTYSEMYWKSDLRSTMNFLALRCDPHAQYEIRAYANAMLQMMEPLAPLCIAAFIDYQLQGRSISRMELEMVRKFYSLATVHTDCLNGLIEGTMKEDGASSREIREFIDMLSQPPQTETTKDAETKNEED